MILCSVCNQPCGPDAEEIGPNRDIYCGRCSEIYHEDGEEMAVHPSRDFMVQQAVLNAAQKIMPRVTEDEGVVSAIKWLTGYMDVPFVTRLFRAEINIAFRRLQGKYT